MNMSSSFLSSPTEIIDIIVSNIADDEQQGHETLLSLYLVDKRLLASAQPFIFQKVDLAIEFEFSSSTIRLLPDVKTMLLARSLIYNSSLRDYTHDLFLHPS
jgi:hypothetical protein